MTFFNLSKIRKHTEDEEVNSSKSGPVDSTESHRIESNEDHGNEGGVGFNDHDDHSEHSEHSDIKNDVEFTSQDVDALDEFGEKIDAHIPDGGLMAWLQVLGSWTAIIMTFGISSGTGVLMKWLEVNYLKDVSVSRIGWMFSVQLFLFYILGVALGPIVDAIGVRILVIIGSVGWVAAIFILSACKEYYQFVLCYSILGGFSSACLFNPSVTVLVHWFSKKRGLAIGIAACGSGVGGIIFTQMFNKLLAQTSFGWAVRAVAFVVLACAVITCATLRSRHTTSTIKWEDMKPDMEALTEWPFIFMVAGLFMVEWGIFVPMQYIVSYAVAQGYSTTFGSNLISYLSTASIVARIFTGYLSDRWGSFNMMILSSFICGILCLAVWLPAGGSQAGLVCFVVFFGIFSGAVISLTLITVPQLSRVKNAGRRYGTAYMVASFAVLTGIPIAGALTAHKYIGVVIFSGVVYLVGATFFALSKHFAVGWKAVF